jgi:RNA-directed DNA polymerase
LANLYLHWFDKRFHASDGPAQWAKARLVRYADDFVVMARHQGARLVGAVESLLEDWLGLKINRDKTRVVNLNDEGAHLDFLGYTFWYAPDRFGRKTRYLKLCPSAKALDRERGKLRALTSSCLGWKPVGELIGDLNRHLAGWANYFGLSYPRAAFRKINDFVWCRLIRHLRRRSQRPIRPAEGSSWYHLLAQLGFTRI